MAKQKGDTSAISKSETYNDENTDNQNELRTLKQYIATRDDQTAIRKMLICKVLAEDDISERIYILQKKYNECCTVSIENIEASICWDNIFTDVKELEIKCEAKDHKLDDDFVIRLREIIREIHDVLYGVYEVLQDDEFYSLEIINNLYFLQEICLEYFRKFKNEIIEILFEILLLHFLKATSPRDDKTKSQIKEIISRTKIHDVELRHLILATCKTTAILNNVIAEMPNLGLLLTDISLPAVTRSALRKNVINCHPLTMNVCKERVTTKKSPILFQKKLKEHINMTEIYIYLKKLEKNWKFGFYTYSESIFIFHIYLCSISSDFFDAVKYCTNASANMWSNAELQEEKRSKLTLFLIKFIPVCFMDIDLNTLIPENKNSLMICYRNILQIVRCGKAQIYSDGKTFITFSDLEAEEKSGCIEAVISFYKAYLIFEYDKIKATKRTIPHRLEALNKLCLAISHHLDNIVSTTVSNNIDSYVKLCWALKEVTIKTMECSTATNAEASCNFSYLLEFYEKYQNTGLRVSCIYNICFLLVKSSGGLVLALYPNLDSIEEAKQLFVDAELFIKHLIKDNHETVNYDEDVYDTLDHIIRCLVEIKHGNYSNISFTDELEYFKGSCILNSKTLRDDPQLHLDAIDNELRTKICFYTNAPNVCEEESYNKYSVKKLYEAKYVSETDIRRLFDSLCAFADTSDENKLDSLRSGVIIRIYKNNVCEALSNIVVNAFKLIKKVDDGNKYIVDGLDAAQYFFRRAKLSFSSDLAKKVALECSFTEDHITREESVHMIEILGIYALFEDVKNKYMLIAKTRNVVRNSILNGEDFNAYEKYVYEMMYEYCDFIDSKIQKSINKPDIASLHVFGTQLANTVDFLEASGKDFEIVLVSLKFVAKLNMIMDNSMNDSIRLLIGNLIRTFHTSLNPLDDGLSLAVTVAQFRIFQDMLELVLLEIEKLPKKATDDFIGKYCLVILGLLHNINHFGVVENLEISKYRNLRDGFLETTVDLNVFKKWEILSYIVAHVNNLLPTNSLYSYTLIFIISNRFTDLRNSFNVYPNSINEVYRSIKRFLYRIDGGFEDYELVNNQLFSEICLILQQDTRILKVMGYIPVTETNKDKICYICRHEIVHSSVKSLGCECKSYVSGFPCLLRYDISLFKGGDPSKFKPRCCICKR